MGKKRRQILNSQKLERETRILKPRTFLQKYTGTLRYIRMAVLALTLLTVLMLPVLTVAEALFLSSELIIGYWGLCLLRVINGMVKSQCFNRD